MHCAAGFAKSIAYTLYVTTGIIAILQAQIRVNASVHLF